MSSYDDSPSIRFGPSNLTVGVRGLLAACVGLFVLQRLMDFAVGGAVVSREVENFLGLVPGKAALRGHVWQFGTYLFVHGSTVHVLFNMLFLWWFGTALEEKWGTSRFLKYYFGTGIGAGLVVTLVAFMDAPVGLNTPVVGASGAIFGVLAAYGVCFKDNVIYVMMILPMRAKYAVLLFGLLELLVLMESPTTRLGALAHVSGMALGYFYLHFEADIQDVISGRRARKRRLKLVVSQPKRLDRKRYIEDQIDPILDKIHDQGMDSLTPREREILEKFQGRSS